MALRSYCRTRIFVMCAQLTWPWRYVLGSRSWQILGSWATIAYNIIQIQHDSKALWLEHGFGAPVCMHCDLDLGNMTLIQGHDTPFVHGHQLCKVLTAMLDLHNISHNCSPWPKSMSRSQFTLSKSFVSSYIIFQRSFGLDWYLTELLSIARLLHLSRLRDISI